MAFPRLSTMFAAVALGGAALAAAGMWDLLPGDGAIPGWGLVPGAERKTCTRAGLYDMYDGAAPDMMGAGVIAAGQRVYRLSGRRLTVDLFRFSSAAKAKAYYQKRQGELRSVPSYAVLADTQQSACGAGLSHSAVAYLWNGQYYASLSVNGNKATDREALRSFARYTAAKITATR